MSVRLLVLLSLTVRAVTADYARDAGDELCGDCDSLPRQCSLASELYPVEPKLEDWTTSKIFGGALPINDETFRPMDILSGATRRVLEAPDGVVSMEGFYPEGSYTFGHTPRGGFSFYAPGPEEVDLKTAQEATFGYTVLFPEGFDWVKGGKIPGLCTCAVAPPPVADRIPD